MRANRWMHMGMRMQCRLPRLLWPRRPAIAALTTVRKAILSTVGSVLVGYLMGSFLKWLERRKFALKGMYSYVHHHWMYIEREISLPPHPHSYVHGAYALAPLYK
jgi:hypothetical protein